jgi:hypothetical protein
MRLLNQRELRGRDGPGRVPQELTDFDHGERHNTSRVQGLFDKLLSAVERKLAEQNA